MKRKLLLLVGLLSISFSVLFSQTPFRNENELKTFDMGDFASNQNAFEGTMAEHGLGVNVDVKYGRSQEIILAEELKDLLGKEITQIDIKIYNTSNYEEVYFTSDLKVFLGVSEKEKFEKAEDGKYYFAAVQESDCVLASKKLTIDKLNELDSEGLEEYTFKFQFDKPFLYQGGNLLLTIESQATSIFGESSRSYCGAICYPKNVKGKPVLSLVNGSDSKNVCQAPALNAPVAAYKERTSKRIYYQEATIPKPVLSKELELVLEEGQKLSNVVSEDQLQFVEKFTLGGKLTQEDIAYLFRSQSLKILDLQKALVPENTLQVPQEKAAVNYLPLLEEVYLGANLVSIGDNAFANKQHLHTFILPKDAQLTKLGNNVFKGNIKLSNISFNGVLETAQKDKALGEKLITIGASAFEGCEMLSALSLPATLEEVGARAFKNCTKFSTKVIPQSIKKLSAELFSGCTSLQEVTIQNEEIQIQEKAFAGCIGLKKIEMYMLVPPSITKDVFEGIDKLKAISVYIPYQGEVAFLQDKVWSLLTLVAVGKPEPAPIPKGDVLELGDFSGTKNYFDASIFQMSPINVDYLYSKSQELMLGSELKNIEGKEIVQINYRLKLPESIVPKMFYEADVDVYIHIANKNRFEKKSKSILWFELEPQKAQVIASKHIKIDAFDLGYNKELEDYVLELNFDKSFLYTGGDLVVTTIAKGTHTFSGDSGVRSFADFYCYPENGKGLPFRTACAADDKTPFGFQIKNVTDENSFGVLRHRAVKQIIFKDKTETPPSAVGNVAALPSLSVRKGKLVIGTLDRDQTIIVYDLMGHMLIKAHTQGGGEFVLPQSVDKIIVRLNDKFYKFQM